ncbi:tRNA pseudouridine(55) synthase TruB [Bacillus aquiflavi]|uniref:tRNA pseudouridine synthase B n=1 Tax=Bacillus aquiflavi TaxID=2672567 RepID=A0A6B3VUH5_9BACI|nr:tRNA pseudouridine(55) synthase TruB [Bacillus aquiflavi]MBA4536234.1 tRNA pseudouridine(55) synthase TruB [Bacillus aquiflavi]NEY80602.1 tRNA pseudouridine(55) synthase TruB [Bacillus aquiflavi]UAC49418.1 tRNA pseudouridine(55) synthase TruB [Bacillus aquiflavi]
MEGILPLYKPKGMTSHDCVFKLRKLLKIKKIGHTGTLDPNVDGVLPICIGRATKVAEFMTSTEKAYEGEVTIGTATTTEDASGEIIASKKVNKAFTRREILTVLDSLTGIIEQTPPMYSAVKVNGKRLYEYARKGIEVKRPTRKVHIYSLQLLDDQELFNEDEFSFKFRVNCSKGTYVRTLAVMIGERLGYPAHMSLLTRIKAATFELKDCLTFDQVEQSIETGNFVHQLFPLEKGISHLPKYKISDKVAEKVRNGAILPTPTQFEHQDEPIVVETNNGLAIAIYIKHPRKTGCIKPLKVLRNDI